MVLGRGLQYRIKINLFRSHFNTRTHANLQKVLVRKTKHGLNIGIEREGKKEGGREMKVLGYEGKGGIEEGRNRSRSRGVRQRVNKKKQKVVWGPKVR